jgi:hypothetical protein
MDPSHFDRLVAALARPASRRATLATLLGGALAGALERTTQDAAANGDAQSARGRCPTGKKHCHGRCIPQHRHCRPPGGCAATGQPCQHNGQCCTNQCDQGVCAPAPGCTETGSGCRQHSDCCSGHCPPQTGTCQDDCGGCPTGQICCGAGQTAACCDPRSCCLAAGGGGGVMCCPRPTCCLIQSGPVCCLGICEVNGSGNFSCRE